ncbi:MAG: hypothetical protein JXA89_08125 [Anaerolineae bacterium]|nr:hypothetical protein [Anaerolineae bacterium]
MIAKMDIRVFIPHALGIVCAAAWFLVLRRRLLPTPWPQKALLLLSFALGAFLFVLLVGLTPSAWLRATPATEKPDVDMAILFGFGYEMPEAQIKPGKANEFLFAWFMKHYCSEIKTILVQDGIWAAVDIVKLEKEEIELIRIHPHVTRTYMDTVDTAWRIKTHLERLGNHKALVIAHDLQLERATWILSQVCPECTFIVPDIPDTPYPERPIDFHTSGELIYKVVELLVSRPRDFIRLRAITKGG